MCVSAPATLRYGAPPPVIVAAPGAAGAAAHSQGPKCVPSATQTCAPEQPVVIAHAWLAPGTQRGGLAGAGAAADDAAAVTAGCATGWFGS